MAASGGRFQTFVTLHLICIPTLHRPPLQVFIDAVWHPLRDKLLAIREAAVQALKVCRKLGLRA